MKTLVCRYICIIFCLSALLTSVSMANSMELQDNQVFAESWLQDFPFVTPLRTVEYYMAQTEPLYNTPGGSMTGAYAYYGTTVDNCADSNGNLFLYYDNTLWRRIKVKEGIYSGRVGWVPNLSVTSRNI